MIFLKKNVNFILVLLISILFCSNAYCTKKTINMDDDFSSEKSAKNEWDEFDRDWEKFFDDFKQMRNSMFNMMEQIYDDDFYNKSSSFNKPQGFVPTIDVKKEHGYVVVSCDLPGMSKNKINVELKDNLLTISGKRDAVSETQEDKEGMYSYKSERNYGSFSRSVKLPDNIDPEDTTADYKNGVLIIKIKSLEPDKPSSFKKIEVK